MATVCLGERVIRAGDVLPVSVLGELELLPVSTGGSHPRHGARRTGAGPDPHPLGQGCRAEGRRRGIGDVQKHSERRPAHRLRPGGHKPDLSARRGAEARQGRAAGKRQLRLHPRQE